MINRIVQVRKLSLRGVVCLLAVLLLIGFTAFAVARPTADGPPIPRDLGDAPDSTNHDGAGMNAYSNVPANFPTVFDPALGVPQGPLHRDPEADSWLGPDVSVEAADADQLPDADGVPNIAPPADAADIDRFDDGVRAASPNGIMLPQCQQTDFDYIVTGATTVITHPAYVNVWIDFNRDGDWADTLDCTTAAGAAVSVPEWAVQNQVVTVNPGSQTYTTPRFASFHPGGHSRVWMRITLAGQPALLNPATGLADGRGPAGGYPDGETEDYPLFPEPEPQIGFYGYFH